MSASSKWLPPFRLLRNALAAALRRTAPAGEEVVVVDTPIYVPDTPTGPPQAALIVNGSALAAVLEVPTGVDAVFRDVDELSFIIADGEVSIAETVSRRDLRTFGLVQMAAYPRPTASLISAVSAYLEHHQVPAVNMAGIGVPTKLVQYVRFALAGLPVPATVYLAREDLARSFPALAQRLELPFVLKALSASGG